MRGVVSLLIVTFSLDAYLLDCYSLSGPNAFGGVYEAVSINDGAVKSSKLDSVA